MSLTLRLTILLTIIFFYSCNSKKEQTVKSSDEPILGNYYEKETLEINDSEDFFSNFSDYKYYGSNLSESNGYEYFGDTDYKDSLLVSIESENSKHQVENRIVNDSVFLKNMISHYLISENETKEWYIWWSHLMNSDEDQIIQYLSKNRKSFDFVTAYNKNRKILLKSISIQEYIMNIRPTLNGLLYAFEVLNTSPNQIDSLYRYLYKEQLDDHSIGKFPQGIENIDNKQDDLGLSMTGYYLRSEDTYAFWMRRVNDGNVENIYRTMLSFKRDFDNNLNRDIPDKWEDIENNILYQNEISPTYNGHVKEINWEYSHCLLKPTCSDNSDYKKQVKSALKFALDEGYFSFFFFNSGYEWPLSYYDVIVTNKISENYEWRRQKRNIEDRQVIRTEAELEDKGNYVYSGIVEFLSANRMNCDFEELYTKNANLISQIITKEIYDENYKDQVNLLISGHEIFDELSEIEKQNLIEVYQLDEESWDEKTSSPIYENFENKLSGIYDFDEDSTAIFNISSFWARRYNEGLNVYVNVYNTLLRIQENYE